MNVLINRAIQCFLRDVWGMGVWCDVARAAGLSPRGFEPLLDYPADLTHHLLAAASVRLNRGRDDLLEDLGTYLVSHPSRAAVRRLLRFGGISFHDFLQSLEDLPARARLALPELALPDLRLEHPAADLFRLSIAPGFIGAGPVALGLLRAMADDYGALVLLEPEGMDTDGAAVLTIRLLDATHGEGRAFVLGAL
ncbi:heme NO-binding domain-containing protein [Paragemmobacter ruber]|uniref:Heme NO-binding protein n=1 Tax=Paragemmobacter ruber TaxID=1985673 RepID=A0ABW9Y1Y0_9RHOB|nr:heme NO-binding domain-containing protein [Rhodobacter ruber]NBE06393.1 heme NO-binding protein [Rhodobacter ruber]